MTGPEIIRYHAERVGSDIADAENRATRMLRAAERTEGMETIGRNLRAFVLALNEAARHFDAVDILID